MYGSLSAYITYTVFGFGIGPVIQEKNADVHVAIKGGPLEGRTIIL